MKKSLFTLSLAGLSLGLSACQSMAFMTPGVPEALADSRWLLTTGAYQGKALNTAAGEITLNIGSNGQLSGVAAINQYRIPAAIHGTHLEHTGNIITTRMAGAMPAMRLESNYLSAMRHADSLSVQDNTLVIRGKETELFFRRAP